MPRLTHYLLVASLGPQSETSENRERSIVYRALSLCASRSGTLQLITPKSCVVKSTPERITLSSSHLIFFGSETTRRVRPDFRCFPLSRARGHRNLNRTQIIGCRWLPFEAFAHDVGLSSFDILLLIMCTR